MAWITLTQRNQNQTAVGTGPSIFLARRLRLLKDNLAVHICTSDILCTHSGEAILLLHHA